MSRFIASNGFTFMNDDPDTYMCYQASMNHNDVINWKHFPHYWPFVRGIHQSPVNSLHKGQWREALMFTLICPNKWLSNNFNTLKPRQNNRHFPDDIFRCIFLNENVWISIKISLKFVPKGPINYFPALVQIMAWCRPGDKSLSEPMIA